MSTREIMLRRVPPSVFQSVEPRSSAVGLALPRRQFSAASTPATSAVDGNHLSFGEENEAGPIPESSWSCVEGLRSCDAILSAPRVTKRMVLAGIGKRVEAEAMINAFSRFHEFQRLSRHNPRCAGPYHFSHIQTSNRLVGKALREAGGQVVCCEAQRMCATKSLVFFRKGRAM